MEEYVTDNLSSNGQKGENLKNTSSTSRPSSSRLSNPRRSQRLAALHQLHLSIPLPSPNEAALQYLHQCVNSEVLKPESGMNPKDYLPEPDHWKKIFKLPEKNYESMDQSIQK